MSWQGIADKGCLLWIGQQLKGGFFQAFVEQPKTGALPDQQLRAVTAAVGKHVDVVTERITAELVGHNAAETVEAFAHLGELAI